MTRLLFATLALLSIVFLSYAAHRFTRFPLDLEFAQWLQGLHSLPLTAVMRAVSFLGSEWVSMLTVLGGTLALWLMRFRLEAIFVALLNCIGYGLSLLLKVLVQRPRPSGELLSILDVTNRQSFPSGHAFYAIIFFGFLFYIASTLVRNRAARLVLQIFLGGLVLLIGLSRVYLGAHWPSDVAGAYFIGGILLVFFLIGLEAFRERGT